MAVREVLQSPHPILRRKAKKVTRFDESLRKLVEDMIDTMHHESGVGLAAPQIGVSLRVIVIEAEEDNVQVFVNPEIIKATGERILREGCLSLKGYYAEVKRHERVTVRAQDLRGRWFKVEAEANLLAHALEHEIDHLNGVLYTDYLESLDQLKRVEEPAAQPAAAEREPVGI